ncbi:hypothetical protein F5Y15DRAFT_305089 [Xylariaceae sp. FL0016]|nr:hypothetical protein F5Y15DRAFT_305089 [Xylariaceae sp. FL0016]
MDIPETAADLSFGVELKFLVPFIRSGEVIAGLSKTCPVLKVPSQSSAHDLWNIAHEAIADTIQRVPGQKAVTQRGLDASCFTEKSFWETHWIVKPSKSAVLAKDDPRYDGYLWIPVELNTPKFSWKCPHSLFTVEQVIRLLEQTYQLVSNHSCEVHVHVGRQDNQDISLSTLRRLAALCWLAEPVLRAVKDPASPNFDHTYTWSSPLRDHSRLAISLGDEEKKALSASAWCSDNGKASIASRDHQALRRIGSCTSHLALAHLLTGTEPRYRRLGFNFNSFGDGNDNYPNKPNTFECRFLEGIIRSDMVTGWVMIVLSMAEASLYDRGGAFRFETLVGRLLSSDQQASLSQRLQVLCEDLRIHAVYYAPFVVKVQRDRHQGPNEITWRSSV